MQSSQTIQSTTKKSLTLFFAGAVLGALFFDQVVVPYKSTHAPLSMTLFWDVQKLLNEHHVDRGTIPMQDQLYGAVHGLVASYKDPYTQFFTPAEDKAFDEEIKGEFEGIGMEVVLQNNVVTVVSPLKGSPAEEAGLLPGDSILKVDGVTTEGEDIGDTVTRMRGPKGSDVVLSVFRATTGESRDITVTRAVITIPTLEYEYMEHDIFYVNIFNFSENVADLFANAMEEYKTSGAKYLVLDVRNNPGGYLEASVDIASWFVPKGESVVIEAPVNEEEFVFRSQGYEGVSPVATYVLINGGSASASEIVAGALQDHKKAIIVGTQSFGKGSVQELFDLAKDMSIKVTVAKWLTPERHWIDQKGITPDIVVEEQVVSGTSSVVKKDVVLEKIVEIVQNR